MWAPSLRVVLIGSCAALLPALASQAQDQTARTFVLGFAETLAAQTNPTLDPAATGGAVLSSGTALSLGMTSTTGTDAFAIDAGVGLYLTRDSDGSISTDAGSRNASLSYSRTVPASAFNVDLGYVLDRIDRPRTVRDFIDENGLIVLPGDPTALIGTGNQEDLTGSLSLELGRTAPFGLTFATDYARTTYSDPTLIDTTSESASIAGRFNYSTNGAVTLTLSKTRDQDAGAAASDNTSFELGTTYAVSPVMAVRGSVTHAWGDSGPSTDYSLGADYTLANGSLSVDLGTDTSRLTYTQNLRAGRLTAALSHGPGDTTGTLDQVGVAYTQSINSVSGIGLGVVYSRLSSAGSTVTGADLIVDYNHALNKDWGLDVGVNYRLRDDTAAGSANSAGIFVTVSRAFNLGH